MILSNWKQLLKSIQRKQQTDSQSSIDDTEVLPPWIFFPSPDPDLDLGNWRQGYANEPLIAMLEQKMM